MAMVVHLWPEPHGRQAGQTVGSDWAREGPCNQTAARIGAGHLTWPGRLDFGSSRGRSLELRIEGAAGPLLASTSAPGFIFKPAHAFLF